MWRLSIQQTTPGVGSGVQTLARASYILAMLRSFFMQERDREVRNDNQIKHNRLKGDPHHFS
jgi:hypothetical protein